METRTCANETCERTNIKARGLCVLHYDQWYTEQRTGKPVRTREDRTGMTCQVEGCDGPPRIRSAGQDLIVCPKHNGRWVRHGSFEKRTPVGPNKGKRTAKGECVLAGCYTKARSKGGMCEMHYHRMRNHGSFDELRTPVPDMTLENLLAKTVPGHPSDHTQDCMLWVGRLDKQGYAYDYDPALHRAGQQGTVFIHRRAYDLAHDEPLGKMTADHRCHDPNVCVGGVRCLHRRCINPDHIVPEPRSVNSKRNSAVQRELSLLSVTDPDVAAQKVLRELYLPCGHLRPKYGPSCKCDNEGATK